jgi:uncharacterized membrane protein YdjX (TVP38/TMEM64 family)
MIRLVSIFLALSLLLLLPLLIWGEEMEALLLGGEGGKAGFENLTAWLRDFGPWAWGAGILLLVGDLLLPIPSTAVISALGWIYGAAIGGLVAAAGSILSGSIAYACCRCFGRGAAKLLAGERNLMKGEQLFNQAGGWMVAFSRWLPVFSEAIACMAGLTGMRAKIFMISLISGSLPLAFTYASIGAMGDSQPMLALFLSAALPLLLWPWARWLLLQRSRSVKPSKPSTPDPSLS